MTLIWAESCGGQGDTATFGWTNTGGAFTIKSDRYGNSFGAWGGNNDTPIMRRTFDVADQHATVIFGGAMTLGSGNVGSPGTLVAGTYYPLVRVIDDAGNVRTTMWAKATNTHAAIIEVRRGSATGGTLLATSTVAVIDDVAWYYVELKHVTDAAAGSVEVRVNEIVKATASGLDTTGGFAGTLVAAISVTMNYVNPYYVPTIDDIYICNGAGAVNNDCLGDVRIARLRPNADGSHSQWVGSDGDSSNNWQQIDNVTFSAAIWNQSSVDEDTDYYNVTNVPAAVVGEQVFGVLFKTSMWCDILNRGAAELVKTAAETERAGVALTTIAGTMFFHVDETQPGGTPWTTAALDTAQVGVRIKS